MVSPRMFCPLASSWEDTSSLKGKESGPHQDLRSRPTRPMCVPESHTNTLLPWSPWTPGAGRGAGKLVSRPGGKRPGVGALTRHRETPGLVVRVPVRAGSGQVVNSHLIRLARLHHKVAEVKTPLERGVRQGCHVTPVTPACPHPKAPGRAVHCKNRGCRDDTELGRLLCTRGPRLRPQTGPHGAQHHRRLLLLQCGAPTHTPHPARENKTPTQQHQNLLPHLVWAYSQQIQRLSVQPCGPEHKLCSWEPQIGPARGQGLPTHSTWGDLLIQSHKR